MKRFDQLTRVGKLISRKCGATALEISLIVGTTAPHKRLSELRKQRGWTITRKPCKDATHGVYFGKAPA